MSLELLKTAFAKAPNCNGWSLQLLRITTSKRHGTRYESRQIELSPAENLGNLVADISKRYGDNDVGELKHYTSVTDYDGTADALTVYKLAPDNELIAEELVAFLAAIATPDVEVDPLDFNPQAYVLKGVIIIDEVETPLKMISMQRPFTILKNKYKFGIRGDRGVFEELSGKVLTLRPAIDVIILGSTVYFLTLAGETLFNMERSYKAICTKKVQMVQDCAIVTDAESFRAVAATGHNPRRFVSFDEGRLNKLKKAKSRMAMAKKFEIPLVGNQFDTSVDGVSEKIVKLLCKKGMVDPFEDLPVEVAGAKKWE